MQASSDGHSSARTATKVQDTRSCAAEVYFDVSIHKLSTTATHNVHTTLFLLLAYVVRLVLLIVIPSSGVISSTEISHPFTYWSSFHSRLSTTRRLAAAKRCSANQSTGVREPALVFIARWRLLRDQGGAEFPLQILHAAARI
jgi:hypothetical protein